MAYLTINNISIEGISAAVPKDIKQYNNEKFISTTGINERRIVENNTCSSDLCEAAANKLIQDLNVDKKDIELLVFISQTPDYKIPVTSTILQHKLNLPQSCICIDIPLGCSGYIYGLYVISSLFNKGNIKKGLLLVGDTISTQCYSKDQSTEPLFGDAGTATLLSYDSEANPILFNLGSDGSGYKSIIIPDGGSRNKINDNSFIPYIDEDNLERRKCDLHLNGIDVFNFGVNKIPKIVNEFINHFSLDKDKIDIFVFHQANKLMNDKIYKKLNLDSSKTLTSLSKFGNTSSATIPLTIVTQLTNIKKDNKLLLCGFGVGLSWGCSYFHLNKDIHCSELIEL
jgi:3-oxoacyl-[acyl-carrier-protein] synthase-3